MHPDLPQEQAYFDRALALRDRQQADLARAPSLAANPKAAAELRRRVNPLGLADPDEAIAFGRIETASDRWYIGKGAIWGDDNDLVVVNWQAPIAAPFYTATPDDPEGLDARRLYHCSGNQIRQIEDLMFREVAQAIVNGREPQPVLTDALLESLGGSRSGELGDIVATIQAAQYDVISRPLEQLLVVQGGPGTGKTVVALHRVSWLLYNRRDRLEPRDVLVVGPNPAFVRYISSVLPSLGDEAVVQLPLPALGPRVRIGRVDPPELRRLKGDRRLLRLILRGLRNRQRVEAIPVALTVDGRQIELDGRRIATRARQLAGRPHNEAYRMLRAFMVGEATAALTGSGGPTTSNADVTVQGGSAREIDNYLGRVWPSLTPQAFLVELLSSRRQLLAAGAGSLTEAELDMLALPADAKVSTWQWSVDDVPLLDAADALLNGVPASYEHIVVDEVQDLSPLQLESIRRRSRAGSMTVLGDLAQGTSPWAHETWDSLVAALRHERVGAETVTLQYGYRLPAEVHDVAMRLVPQTAPDVVSPQALRSSGRDVLVATADEPADLVAQAVATIGELLGDGIMGVILPASARTGIVGGLDAAGIAWAPELRPSAAPVVVLTPDEAKGLEFDVVVVVEPAAIVDESERGLRSLFVAMTRCTSQLALVHGRPLPAALGLGPGEGGGFAERTVQLDADSPVTGPAGAGAGDPAADHASDRPADVTVATPQAGLDDGVAVVVPAFDDEAVGVGSVGLGGGGGGEVDGVVDDEAVAVGSVGLGGRGEVDGVVDHDDAGASGQGGGDAEQHRSAGGAGPRGEEGSDERGEAGSRDSPAGSAPATVGTDLGSVGHHDPAPVAPTLPLANGHAHRPAGARSAPGAPVMLDALDGLDHDIARAIAVAVADKVAHLVAPSMLPLVAAELHRALVDRTASAASPPDDEADADAGQDASAVRPPRGVHTP